MCETRRAQNCLVSIHSFAMVCSHFQPDVGSATELSTHCCCYLTPKAALGQLP